MKALLIKDAATRNAVKDLEEVKMRLERIKSAQKIAADPTAEDYNRLVDIINQITDSMKRR